MRTAFIQSLCALAEADERIWLLCGDLGYSVLEPFARTFPDRFINAGVAEQNMTGVATGLALSGKVVFIYSIANFPVMRCLEQVRNDVCYHNANVKIVAVGGGLSYGAAGYSHFAVEDLAVMRSLPNMTVVAPGDPVEVRLATAAIVDHHGPCYLRLGKGGDPSVHLHDPEFQLGRAIQVREGHDATLVSTGGSLAAVMAAAQLLAQRGVEALVLSVHTVKPLDETAIRLAAATTRAICVVEEHGPVGGLSDAVARCLAGRQGPGVCYVTVPVEAIIADARAGSQAALLERHGLTAVRICDEVIAGLAQTALR
jgi:transketolase